MDTITPRLSCLPLIRLALSTDPRRRGFAQRALLLSLAFARNVPVERLERTIHDSTYHRFHPLGEAVANELARQSILPSAEDFPQESFAAWLGRLELRIKTHQRPPQKVAQIVAPPALSLSGEQIL